jgi:hypothetical protein
MTEPRELFAALAAALPPPEAGDTPAISVPKLVEGWLGRGPERFAGADQGTLNELCRQIDVRKKVSAGYGAGWTRLDPEVLAGAEAVSGVVAVLLANAGGVGEPGPDGARNDGWGLKCVNSALKVLELRDDIPHASDLRVWAMEALDRVRTGSDQ